MYVIVCMYAGCHSMLSKILKKKKNSLKMVVKM